MSSVPSAAHAPPLPVSAVDDTRALYEQYGQRIFAFCLSRLRSREEAEDAAQTTFVYALRGLQRGIEPRSALAWLFKIAENVCHSRHRAASRRLRHEADRADVERLSAPVRAADELIGLSEALAAMPERQRRAILLREWRGLSYEEIGQELGLSQSAVETLLFRARRTLASRLRALDLGSALAFLRGLLTGGAGKAVATVAVVSVGATLAVMPVVEHMLPGDGRPAHERPLVTSPNAAGTGAVSRTSGIADQAGPVQSRLRTTAREAPRPGVAPTPKSPTAQPEAAPTGPGSATPAPSGGTEGGTTAPTAAPSSTGADTGATTPAVSADATASTNDGTVTASADVGVQTPAGSTTASASADVGAGGVNAGVDVSSGSQSAGTQVTVPPPPPPPTLP